MGILIGMDEAGYGPNLGPLVVAASVWEVAEEGAGSREQGAGKRARRAEGNGGSVAAVKSADLSQCDLYRSLRTVVSRTASEQKIAVADSKQLYKPGHGLRQLERGVHAVLAAIERPAACWSAAVDSFAADPNGVHQQLCWHNGFDCRLPVDATSDELLPLGPRFAAACEKAAIRPLAIRARLVFPAEFNELTDRFESKGAALSHVTIGLLREVVEDARCKKGAGTDRSYVSEGPTLDSIGASPLFALCDKHGARNRYGALLQHHFHEHWVETVSETHTESRYEFGPPECRTQVAFRMQGESFLPTALASMTAKYLRELSMRAFNEFWCAKVPGLRPTAGYPGDAPRFKQAIANIQRELGVDDHIVWRNR